MGGAARKKQLVPEVGRATEELLSDSEALDQIVGLLASRPWGQTDRQIATFLRETGRDVAEGEGEPEEGEFDDLEVAGEEGWPYADEDDEPAEAWSNAASAYARLSRVAGAENETARYDPDGHLIWKDREPDFDALVERVQAAKRGKLLTKGQWAALAKHCLDGAGFLDHPLVGELDTLTDAEQIGESPVRMLPKAPPAAGA